jgi:Ca2+-dependent lipid-binding protein
VMELKFSKDLKWSMLDIRVNKAVLRRDTEVIGKMDPFVEIKLGEQTKRTTVKDEAGMYPVWGELYTIPVINPLIAIKFTVFDEDVTTNDLVGAAEIDMDERGMLSGF